MLLAYQSNELKLIQVIREAVCAYMCVSSACVIRCTCVLYICVSGVRACARYSYEVT